ncbi:hypothetical protein BT93_H3289 [Corymbia citriodora subsp. variegata]|nr:hypothetical protein BT93_H3289 [Corymbia citriodora subsp. variegata]
MSREQVATFSVESVVEDVLQQHRTRLSDCNLASRKEEEASSRRYEAAGWLRKTVGVVGGKDLPAHPSEEEFRLGLRSGIILCNVLNKVQPGAIPKVVEAPSDSVIIPDGAALSAYQYFENVRNFLVIVEEMGLPTFEASDLEQGGKSARIVNCVLALKAYGEWKQGGGVGSWKLAGAKPTPSNKQFIRKNSELFMNSFSRTSSASEKSLEGFLNEHGDICQDLNVAGSSRSLQMLVRQVLSDRKQEDIPIVVESLLSKVMEEFECRLASQNELMKTELRDVEVSCCNKSSSMSGSEDTEIKEQLATHIQSKEQCSQKLIDDEASEGGLLKKQQQVEQQQKDIQELKHTVCTAKEGMQFLQMKHMEELANLGKYLHSFANAASGYQKVLEENRRLYNQVQDLKGNIRVYCRVRPFLPGQANRLSTVDRIEEGNITVNTFSKYGKEARKSFTFNKVFGPSATQVEVFSDTQPLIRSVLDGYNVCIFAYGQTGSGKTYTMTGPKELTEESMGVNFRALSDLFLFSEQRKGTILYEISVQMIEIYNEQVRDLLVTDGQNKRVEIRNSSQNGINVPDANLVPVSSSSDVLKLMNLGNCNRAVGATALNDRSSRSHSCLTVHVQGKVLTSGAILRGCMHLVDLAGSERVDKSEVTGDRLKEAQHINKSLSALGDVISSLAQKNSHVPYRNSKLTQLLQDSLGGQAKTLMFVHISPEPDAIGESISTLKFAERVSTVELGAARVNKDSADVKELKEQIAGLKAALAKKEGERQQRHRSRSTSPERFEVQSTLSMQLSWESPGHVAISHRQPMEDVGNIEVQNKSTSKQKRQSLDLQDMLANSPPWLPAPSPRLNGKDDEKELVSGEWVDKVMVKKHDALSREEHPPITWEAENGELPRMFFQRNHSEPSLLSQNNLSPNKIKNNQDCDVRRDQCNDNDSDDLEAATSDSSEPDLLWQYSASKVARNGLASRVKKPQPKTAKSPETRSLIPTLAPSPSRKPSRGGSLPPHKARQPATADGRRSNGYAK